MSEKKEKKRFGVWGLVFNLSLCYKEQKMIGRILLRFWRKIIKLKTPSLIASPSTSTHKIHTKSTHNPWCTSTLSFQSQIHTPCIQGRQSSPPPFSHARIPSPTWGEKSPQLPLRSVCTCSTPPTPSQTQI